VSIKLLGTLSQSNNKPRLLVDLMVLNLQEEWAEVLAVVEAE
jgi:hypothetical protein